MTQSTDLARTGASTMAVGVRAPAALVERAGRLYPTTEEWTLIMNAAAQMWKSGIAKAMNFETETAIVTVALKGWELGVPLMASLEGMPIIKGKPRPTGALLEYLGARIGGRVEWIQDGRSGTAECIAYRPGKKPVRGMFTMEDAKRAGLTAKDTYQQYPFDMLCKRALSRATWKQYSDLYFGHVPSANEVADDEGGVADDAETVTDDGGDGSVAPANGSVAATATTKTTRRTSSKTAPADAAPAGSAAAPAATTSTVAAPASTAAPQTATPPADAPTGSAAASTAPATDAPAAAPSGSPAQPEDKPVHLTKGEYAGRMLSQLTEADLRKIIPGLRIAVANDKAPAASREAHAAMLPHFEAWAAFRGIVIPPTPAPAPPVPAPGA